MIRGDWEKRTYLVFQNFKIEARNLDKKNQHLETTMGKFVFYVGESNMNNLMPKPNMTREQKKQRLTMLKKSFSVLIRKSEIPKQRRTKKTPKSKPRKTWLVNKFLTTWMYTISDGTCVRSENHLTSWLADKLKLVLTLRVIWCRIHGGLVHIKRQIG